MCGYYPECSLYRNALAVTRAKKNVENYFAVVGILEHLNETLQLLEHEVPNILGGITNKPGENCHDYRRHKKVVSHP